MFLRRFSCGFPFQAGVGGPRKGDSVNKGPSVCVPVFLSLCLAEFTSLNLGKTASHRYESLLLYLPTILLFCQNTLTPVRPWEAKRRRAEISVFPRRTLRQGTGSPLPGRTQSPWALKQCLWSPVWALSTVPHHSWSWVGSPVPWEGRGLGRAQTGVSPSGGARGFLIR